VQFKSLVFALDFLEFGLVVGLEQHRTVEFSFAQAAVSEAGKTVNATVASCRGGDSQRLVGADTTERGLALLWT